MKRQYKYLVTAMSNAFPAIAHVYVFAPTVKRAKEVMRENFSGDYTIENVTRVNVTAPELFPNAFIVRDDLEDMEV